MNLHVKAAAVAALLVVGAVTVNAGASAFIAGDLAVLEANSGVTTAANTPTPIVIIELAPVGLQVAPVQSIAIPSTFSTNSSSLTVSASATSTGYVKVTGASRNLLAFTGANGTGALPTSNNNSILQRGVGTVDAQGNYTLATTYTGTSGNQTRSAVTNDGTNFYIGDQGGIYLNGGTAAQSTGLNPRGLQIYNGVTHILQASATTTIPVVSSLAPPLPPSSSTPVTSAGLPGLPNLSTATDFVEIASGNTGTTPDTLYVSTTAGVSKFALVGGSWVAEGSATVTGGLFSITGKVDPVSGFDLYATAGTAGSTGNSVVSLLDISSPTTALSAR